MNISRPFVERPVATALLMVAVLLAGVLAYRALPVSALPEVDYPTIQVYTNDPGSAPDVTSATLTAPLERQFGQMAGLQQMDSTSTEGASVITLRFELSTSLDEAEQEVQAAINAASAYLPKNLPYPPVYSKVNPADTAVLTLAMRSEVLPLTRVQELAEIRVAQKISQMSGVGLVTVSGGQRPAVRVAVNTSALAQLGLTLDDVTSAIQKANVNGAKGSIDGRYLSYAIGANDQLTEPAQFRALVIAWHAGAAVRLQDVAQVSEGAEDVRQSALSGTQPAILISIQRQPGANVIATVDRVRAALPALSDGLPAAVKLTVLNDRTDTIRASVSDVQWELLLAIALVVAVIGVFLRNTPATLIPAISVPLSLLGTIGVAYALGFSLNNLALMALTVATGFLVDDAIVMVENISRHIEEGASPREAALAGAGEVGFTIVSLSVALIAVMIPLLFMGDVVGRLFREFALTLSAAIVVSALITLTLTPMLCARLLRADRGPRPFALFDRLDRGYARLLGRVLSHRRATVLTVLVATLATGLVFLALPKGFFPTQDTGLLQGVFEAPPGSSFARMQRAQQRIVQQLLADPEVAGVSASLGIDQTQTAANDGPVLIRLKHGASSAAAIQRLTATVTDADDPVRLYLRPVQDLTLDTQGGASTYGIGLSSPDSAALWTWTPRVIAAMRADPVFVNVRSQALQRGPQAMLDVDRASASRLGVSMQAVDDALYAAYGQSQVSTIYTDLTQYHVVLGTQERLDDIRDLLRRIYVPGSDGAAIPLASFSRISLRQAPLARLREGQFPYMDISFDLADGHALGDAVAQLHRLQQQLHLPASVQLVMQGSVASFASSSSGQAMLMAAAVVVVYLMLGMLYESFIHPLTILSTLPPAALGALLALWIGGQQFDVISLIGIVLLVGIVMKNAIMMIDFAIELERQQRLSPLDAIRRACELRFRPILMTTMASLLGAVPLAFGGGVGAELRAPLGLAIIGGLVVSQLLTLFSTPVIYLLLHRAETALARRL